MGKIMILIVLVGVMVTVTVRADPPGIEDQRANMTLYSAIMALQPGVTEERSKRLARIFEYSGKTNGFDPRLIVAVAFRESSLVSSIEKRERFGKSNHEIGLMQCHGLALSFRPEECTELLESAYCQIETGTRYLAHIRDDLCPGSTWKVLAAYGHGVCMSERDAKNDRGVKRVMKFYAAIGGKI